MKYSRQRELIREALEQSGSHPTADAIYQEVRKKEPTISLATVYRNINQLAENHMIRRIVVPGDSDHFDHTLAYHEHMICTQCGCVVDIWPKKPLLEQFQSFSDAEVTGYDCILYGRCRNCADQVKQPQN
ncbi:MAG: transcriptional repressor [Eubacteriales bacterium]|nr:transcriptional repressor [Eubacteriales bacterium]